MLLPDHAVADTVSLLVEGSASFLAHLSLEECK
jgi:hypothetical protein